jgi:hypothetical protein
MSCIVVHNQLIRVFEHLREVRRCLTIGINHAGNGHSLFTTTHADEYPPNTFSCASSVEINRTVVEYPPFSPGPAVASLRLACQKTERASDEAPFAPLPTLCRRNLLVTPGPCLALSVWLLHPAGSKPATHYSPADSSNNFASLRLDGCAYEAAARSRLVSLSRSAFLGTEASQSNASLIELDNSPMYRGFSRRSWSRERNNLTLQTSRWALRGFGMITCCP